jgi:dihydrodipicolinate synthase/N-acetylneuraminate lyase
MGELIRKFGDRLNVLSGAESALLEVMLLGGKGSVGVWATAYPKWCLEFYDACAAQKWDVALRYHRELIQHRWAIRYDSERRLGGNKAIAMAAGRKGGPLREPFRKATPRALEYHRRWLRKIGELQ